MTFNLDSINNKVIHCTNQFETEILSNDFAINSTGYGAYNWNAAGSTFVGATAHGTLQSGVSHGTATPAAIAEQARRIFKLAVGKYERIKYKFEILNVFSTDSDADYRCAVQVPAGSEVINMSNYTVTTATAGTDSQYDDLSSEVLVVTNDTELPNGSWINLRPGGFGGASDNGEKARLAQGGTAGPGYLSISGILEASSTAGELSFWMSQADAKANPTVTRAGSTFQYLRF
jgi:hypothetical protein